MGKRNCLFCGSAGPLTRSHVIARQLIDALPGTKEGSRFIEVRHDQFGRNPKVEVRESSKNPRENKPKVLCGPCNNSWMKDHEEKVKDLVVSLALGEAVNLTIQNQTDLALWAAIAGAVRGALSFETPLPKQDATYIRENDNLPNGYWVWLIQGEDKMDWPTRFMPVRDYDGNAIGWISWLWVGKAIFAVASEKIALDFYWKLGRVAPLTKRIYPGDRDLAWPYFDESPLTWQQFHQVTDP